ncbi:abortive infection family protein [Bacillus cereus group sp. BfR-BA-01518]|uniref:abortive infection family protein n=1 Tax=Bacillus cereus group sp. BfR-BA-01518 TaxID=2920368 RepID=UPI001F5A169F|nr:abortive infection family protein [Bacillus cereus group sp. BfR-BA-01518]
MNNYSLSILDNCKSGLIETIESYSTKGEFDYNWRLSNIEYQKARKILMKIYDEMPEEIHEVIKKCRDVKEFIRHLHGIAYLGNYDYRDIQLEISEMFNPAMDYIENKNIEVKLIYIKCDVPKELTYEHILEDLKQCDKRIADEDYSGAITRARRLIEGVFKEIIFNVTGEEVNGNEKLPALLKKVQKCLNLDSGDENLADPLKQVISGLVNVVNGLTAIRNKVGDAHSNNSNLRLHHALLVVNSAKTLVTFLFDTYDYQRERNTLVVNK